MIVQTINALSLSSSILDYGTFARSILETYERLREPIFEKVISAISFLGFSIDFFQLDFLLFYSLLSFNAYLAIPLVVNRWKNVSGVSDKAMEPIERLFKLSTGPWVMARGFSAHFFANFLPPNWREVLLKIREAQAKERNQRKLFLSQKQYAKCFAYYLYNIVVKVFLILLALLTISVLTLFSLVQIIYYLILIAISLVVMPAIPFAILAIVLFGTIWAFLFPSPNRSRMKLITDGETLLMFKTMVLPWFIPLLTVFGGVFAIYMVDSLIERSF